MIRVVRAVVVMALLPTQGLLAQTARAPRPALDSITVVAREGTRLAFDLSRDGREIVFDLFGQLWTLPAAGGEARPLTNAVRDTADDADPAISPDGRRVAFRADRPGGRGVFVLDRATGATQRLIDPFEGWTEARSLSWSPDGRRLLFVLRDTLHVLDVGSGVAQPVVVTGLPSPPVRDAAWTDGGARILFVNAAPYDRAGGRPWTVGVGGGAALPAGDSAQRMLAPVPAPRGDGLAWQARDSLGRLQLWVRTHDGAVARRLTDRADLAPTRARWSADARTLLYAADGRLWRVPVEGGAAREIPFSARVSIPRRTAAMRRVRFPPPDSLLPARGFMGLALAPDGREVALIALGRLWLVPVDGGRPRVVGETPPTASGLSWSPDGERVVWSAGPGGAEDLFVTEVRGGRTRRVTALPGREERAAWSPDGRWLAFLHWGAVPRDSAPWSHNGWSIRLRVIAAAPDTQPPVARLESTRDLGAVAGFDWIFAPITPLGLEVPQWSPDGDALLQFGAFESTASLVALDATRRAIPRFPRSATFVQWGSDSTLVFVRADRLWRVRFGPATGAEGSPELLDEPALHPSRARDGSVAYLSSDGIRIWRPNLWRPQGRVLRLGWPLVFRASAPPPPLLVRDARVVTGTGTAPIGRSDLLLSGGRIARIAPAGTLRANGARVVDAKGRTALPGLIDLHGHLWDDATLFGALAAGTTTLRDMGSTAARTAGFRDAVMAGVMAGPRVVLGGFQFNPVESDGVMTGGVMQSPSDRAVMERGLALADALGADFAKMRVPQSVAAAVRFVDAAHRRGLPVTSHCALALPLVAAGVDGKEHLGPACEERYDGRVYGDVAALLRASGQPVVPTIASYESVPWLAADTARLGSADSASFVTPWLHWWMLRQPPRTAAAYRRYAEDARQATRTLHDAGVTIGAGSDIAAPALAMHLELQQLVAAGMTPLQAIAAATGNAARILGATDIGVLRQGALADLLLVDGDPLTDIRDTRKIWMVVQGGRVVDRATLVAGVRGP